MPDNEDETTFFSRMYVISQLLSGGISAERARRLLDRMEPDAPVAEPEPQRKGFEFL